VQQALARRPVPPVPDNAPPAVREAAAALRARLFWSNLKVRATVAVTSNAASADPA